ncbi:unnamed protein product [Cochlearia groenlandica]
MGDKDKEEENNTKRGGGNDWEVVSLTASAYAASPGPIRVSIDDVKDPQTSHPLYLSGHFAFPLSEGENNNATTGPSAEIYEDNPTKKKKIDFEFSVEQETVSCGKEEGDLTLKGLGLTDEFAGLELFEEKGKTDENIYNKKTSLSSSLHDERAVIGGSHVCEHKEPIHEPEPIIDVSSDLNQSTKDEKHQVADVPSPPEAWWKRSVASLISQAKETNTVWSIFVAAALMGIVIIGQQWQREKWQILQLKWESSIGNEKGGRLIGPISRLKQAFVGGHRRDSFIQVSPLNES